MLPNLVKLGNNYYMLLNFNNYGQPFFFFHIFSKNDEHFSSFESFTKL